MKKKTLLTSLLLSGALLIAACGTEDTVSEKTTVDSETEVSEPSETKTSAEEKEEEPSETGKRSNPVPVGEPVVIKEAYYDDSGNEFEATYQLTVTDVIRGEEAFDILLTENQFNEPAPEGMEWLIISLEGELLEGDEDVPYYVMPWFSIIDSTGSEVSQDIYGTFDGNEYGYVDLFPGGTTAGRISMYAPEGDESLLTLQEMFGSGVYFSLSSN